MKKIFIIAVFIFFAGVTEASAQEGIKEKISESSSDSITYDLLIIDAGFDSWLATQVSADYRSNEYYRNWNQRYVTEWNTRFLTQGARYPQIENYIEYDAKVDYGLDINYRLYMYFQFFEEKNNITLVRRK